MLIMRGNCELIWWDKKETGTIITPSTVHIGVEQSKTTKVLLRRTQLMVVTLHVKAFILLE